ncbi:MAG: hypothetical protein HW387_753 [Parachlamydiales bacterium]|nr:hypothetical protein [Parachlamydiales bacterium]
MLTSTARRGFQHGAWRHNWQGESSYLTASFTPLYKQLEKTVIAAKNCSIPRDWKPNQAHLGQFTLSAGMLIWAISGNDRIANQRDRSDVLLADDFKSIVI